MIKPKQLGHLVLRVRDLERSEDFYSRILGLEVNDRAGDSMVFFRSNTDVHHDLAIAKIANDSAGPEPNMVGLYHFAYELGSLDELREAYRLLNDEGIRIAGFGDHGETKGLYLLDPDGIEIELYAFAPEHEHTPLQEILTQSAAEEAKAG
jgi:catechol 2,3-dioxygenase